MTEKRKLKRNAVRCKLCNTIIESKHRHDFVSCECGNIFVDGGLDYLRRGGDVWMENVEDLTEWEEDETDIQR